ncbi:MAG: nitroreductase family protein [Bacteroidales bacterium]|nr:nitroreductase family protein [Bacteroidales bacterium]MDD7725172.1 nitroreductase family protein [Bacteroidales bacterium]MDY4174874.1 nitroreductase family protein [Bacteroidales bacterium]
MDVKDAILKRRSVRKYSDRMPDHSTLIQVLEAARMAPSATNRQPYRLVCVTTPDLRAQVIQAYHGPSWIKTAPAVIVVLANHDKGWVRSYDGKEHSEIDATIATDHMTLRAAELGLGTCWVCNFNTDEVRQALNLPSNEEPIALLPIGYPDPEEIPKQKNRKPAEDVYSFA